MGAADGVGTGAAMTGGGSAGLQESARLAVIRVKRYVFADLTLALIPVVHIEAG
jgi:hypothetical protein